MKDSRWLQRVEMVAAISVVITLVLLVIEVRGNTRALEPSDDLAAEIRSLLSFPDNQVSWRQSAGGLDAEFTAYVERVTNMVPPADAAASD